MVTVANSRFHFSFEMRLGRLRQFVISHFSFLTSHFFILASGKGFEPLSTGSEPAVLPVRRPRNDLSEPPALAGGSLYLAGKAGLEPAKASLKN